MNKRMIYILLSVALTIIEIVIAKYTHGFIRGSVGDVLVVVLIFCILQALFLTKNKLLPVYVFSFAVFVEILQLFDIVKLVGLDSNYIISTAVGGTFSFGDIICYAVGSIICFLLQKNIMTK